MARDNPDAVVFIIGTNDASIVNTYDANNDGEARLGGRLPRQGRPDDGHLRRRLPSSHGVLARTADAR